MCLVLSVTKLVSGEVTLLFYRSQWVRRMYMGKTKAEALVQGCHVVSLTNDNSYDWCKQLQMEMTLKECYDCNNVFIYMVIIMKLMMMMSVDGASFQKMTINQ